MNMNEHIEKSFELAHSYYKDLGIDIDDVITQLRNIPISIHCWQGDDLQGFENKDGELTGGIQVTGNYPGKARTPEELRQDLSLALSLIPGKHRINLHSTYGESEDETLDRTNIKPKHFANWVNWAKEKGLGLDFNPTCFSHQYSDDGFTLSHWDKNIRDFWIEHCKACRRIGAYFGKELGTPAINNIWIPDGYKDIPVDRLGPRKRLADALDQIFQEEYSEDFLIDTVESKLFGIGAESYTVGSHEFYLSYALKNNKSICLDIGHFHPTEVVSDKLSALLPFMDHILLHISRGVRWDSDHVVVLNEEVQDIAYEIIRSNSLDKVHIGLDYFDGSINRLAAWVIGVRNIQKALLRALLEPTDKLKAIEMEGNYGKRLMHLEEQKSQPWTAVWDYYCHTSHVPVGTGWYDIVEDYESNELSKRL